MEALKTLEQSHRKVAVALVRSGDTVKVHQIIREGSKQRVQIFEGVVIRTHRLGELSAVITVRRIASGVGVEKTFLLHSPNVTKVEVMRRAKVRRNFLSYLRGRRGKSARLKELGFDKAGVNVTDAPKEDQKADADQGDQADADLTELPTEEKQGTTDVSLDEVTQEEDEKAAAEDPVSPVENAELGEENQLAADEAQAGVDRADSSKE